MKRTVLIIIFVASIGLYSLYFYRLFGTVIASEQAIIGEGVISIRELQRAPSSFAGLFGLGDCIQRFEYVPHRGWPLVSAISFTGESYRPSKIRVKWIDYNSAEVSMDDQMVFFLDQGHWRLGGD